MSVEPDLSTEAARLRYAANVIFQYVGGKKTRQVSFDGIELLAAADAIEKEECSTRDELARDIAKSRGVSCHWEEFDRLMRSEYRKQADYLIESGWGKGGSR